MRKYFLTAALASLVSMPLAAQVTVTTGAPAQDIGPFGRDAAFGTLLTAMAQTFMAPIGTNNLQSFSFYIGRGYGDGGASLLLDASVYLFSTDHIVGNALFTTQLTGTDAFTAVIRTFGSPASPLNVSLAAGSTYALVLSSAERFQLTPDGGTILMGATDTDSYSNGSLLVSQAQNLGALKVGGSFVPYDGAPDAAFTAVFTNVASSVVPEPASVVLFGSGLVLLGVVGARRKRRTV